MLVQSYGIVVPRAQKGNFPFHTTTCVNTALKVQETVITDISFVAPSQTATGFFLSQTKYPTYQMKKPSLIACLKKC
jgi:hypothetical protein